VHLAGGTVVAHTSLCLRGQGGRQRSAVEQGTCPTGQSQITYDILAYLAEHPKAQDTVEGIVEWWLLEERIKNRTITVQEALAELVAKGFVLKREGVDTRTFYRINRRKYRQIQSLLTQRRL
jgi:hypothetical protein